MSKEKGTIRPTLGDVFRQVVKHSKQKRSPRQQLSTISPAIAAQIAAKFQAEAREFLATNADGDPRPIVKKLLDQARELAPPPDADDAAIIRRRLDQLPSRDYNIFRLFKQGIKIKKISEMMGMAPELVRDSLEQTYVFVLHGGDPPGGPGEPNEALPENEHDPVRAA